MKNEGKHALNQLKQAMDQGLSRSKLKWNNTQNLKPSE